MSEISYDRTNVRLLVEQAKILELIAADYNLSHILEKIVLLIEELAWSTRATILLVDDSGLLRTGAAPTMPRKYCEAIDGARIGPQAGSCGTAAYRGKRVITMDTHIDPLWENYRDLAREHGVRACWSTPINSKGKTVATFAMYYGSVRAPTDWDYKLIDRATALTQIAIERDRANQALKASENKFSILFESCPVGLSVCTYPAGIISHVNKAWLEITGFNDVSDVIGRTSVELGLQVDIKQRQDILDAVGADGCVRNKEMTFINKRGKKQVILVSSEQIQIQGVTFLLSTNMDITEKKSSYEGADSRLSETAGFL